MAGCSRGSSPTRTPVPTWTPTPSSGAVNSGAVNAQSQQTESQQNTQSQQNQAAADGGSSLAVQAAPAGSEQPANAAAQVAAAEPALPTPVPVDEPTATPIPPPTEVPTETPEPIPTETPTPSGPQYEFELETAEKFPTDSLAENVVRVFLYVYSGGEFALPGYSLVVAHDNATLPVDTASTGGLPDVTRDEPGIYTRFTNMNAIFIEPQGGTWAIQLVDDLGVAVGPPAFIELAPDDASRELYVRYRRK